jgi:hypothetical protein
LEEVLIVAGHSCVSLWWLFGASQTRTLLSPVLLVAKMNDGTRLCLRNGIQGDLRA